MSEATKTPPLPTTIISTGDVGRLIRELEEMGENLHQARLRAGKKAAKPQASTSLEQLAKAYKYTLDDPQEINDLSNSLQKMQKSAPVLHISFASVPTPSFLESIITWLRREIHPKVLLQIGLQPSIAAGCIIRTPNHYFDFSLRKDLLGKKQLLLDKLKGSHDQ
jgi:hypothetical protein